MQPPLTPNPLSTEAYTALSDVYAFLLKRRQLRLAAQHNTNVIDEAATNEAAAGDDTGVREAALATTTISSNISRG